MAPIFPVCLTLVLSVRLLVGASRKALAKGSMCAMSAGGAFENLAPGVLLWYPFQTVVKIAHNLSIFTLHQKTYADETVVLP